MFSIFKKVKHKRIDDSIYISRSVADNAYISEFNRLNAQNCPVFLFCFFQQTIIRLQPHLHNAVILNAEKITSDYANIKNRNNIQQKQNPIFLFAEHHPHLYYEQKIINEIEVLCDGHNPSVGFFTALDEPLMQQFGSEKIIELMKKLGMKDDEVISSSIVTKSVENAQKKIAKKVTNAINAKSQEDWVKINLLTYVFYN